MTVYETWLYGEGDGPRLRYDAVSEEHAVKTFLDRRLATGVLFRDHLADRMARVHVCVKDPARTGTRTKPNYPSVVRVPFDL